MQHDPHRLRFFSALCEERCGTGERSQSKAHGGETKSSGTILNSRRLAPKGRAPRMGRVNRSVHGST